MRFARHHRFALAAAVGLSSIAVFDAVTHGLTGHWSIFADDGNVPWIQAAGDFVHGLAYAGGLCVLHLERARLRPNRAATVFRWLLIAAFVPLAVGFLTVAPLQALTLGPDSVYRAVMPVIGTAFFVQFVAAGGLGLSLLRHPPAGIGSRILLAFLPLVALTVLVALLAPNWAHPAYLEACVVIGTALLGTGPGSPDTGRARAVRTQLA